MCDVFFLIFFRVSRLRINENKDDIRRRLFACRLNILYKQGKITEAEQLINQRIQKDPHNFEGQYHYLEHQLTYHFEQLDLEKYVIFLMTFDNFIDL